MISVAELYKMIESPEESDNWKRQLVKTMLLNLGRLSVLLPMTCLMRGNRATC